MSVLVDGIVDVVVVEERLLPKVLELPLELLEIGVFPCGRNHQVVLDLRKSLNLLVF